MEVIDEYYDDTLLPKRNCLHMVGEYRSECRWFFPDSSMNHWNQVLNDDWYGFQIFAEVARVFNAFQFFRASQSARIVH